MRRKTRGMSLVEVLVGGAILVAIIFTLTAILLDSLQIRARMEAKTNVQSSARLSLDKISRDTSAASGIKSCYTYGSFNVCAGTDCLILRVPAFDSANADLGDDDVIVYQLLAPTIPATLEKRVFPAPGSQRAMSTEVLSQNVQLMELLYYVRQPINCDGITTQHVLNAVPDNKDFIVVEDGVEKDLTAVHATYNSVDNTVTFDVAPAVGTSFELLYLVNPQAYPDQVSMIEMNLGMQRYTITGSGFTKSNQFFSTTRAQLMNN